MKKFVFISLLIIIGGLTIFYISFKSQRQEVCGNEFMEPFCGTNAFYDEATSEGRQIFNANCAACHKLDKHMTGPALRDMGQKYDTLTILRYLHGDKSQIESMGYNNICVRFPQLTQKDVANIIKYTE